MIPKPEEMLRSGEYCKGEKAQHQQSKWENNLYKLFGIFTERPRAQKPNYLLNKPPFHMTISQLATCITATTMMLSWNYSTWNTSAISCCVGTGPPDSAGVATGLVVSVSLLTEKQHHLEQLLDTIAESKQIKAILRYLMALQIRYSECLSCE